VELTGLVEAATMHAVITSARQGLDGHVFNHVVLIGHSVGSIEAVLEASTYHDVDGLILTGYGHHMNYPHLLNVFATSLRPAPLVPGYKAAAPGDAGYLTSLPGTRYADFDAPAHVDPAVIAHDEMTKDVFSVAEPVDGVPIGVLTALSLGINAPVAVVVGAEDSFFCGGEGILNICTSNEKFHASEAPYFSPAAGLTTAVISGAGHDLNMMDNSASTFQKLLAWSTLHVPA
jgi:pimeloyl-ACP methyl ester carboxylesterase